MSGNIAQQIAAPYSEAMLSIAKEQNLVNEFGEDARGILSVLDASSELEAFLGNPLVPTDNKKSLLQQAFEGKVQPFVLNILNLLADRRRIFFLRQVCDGYLALQRKLQKIALAEVTSATELSDAQKQSVIERVRQISQAEGVELQAKVDPELIGGVIIRVGSQVIDASLRGQLRRLAYQLS
ncbi:ATP synthase F1 subunit delta [Synechococcus sp. PCC 7336]|uniref:ATP synthase F1 subunit delta n=1 Tax=Synechococcus sp. PCC 7336 TaxID=195250 RepID=UPI0003460D3F|nr:ATP synthase F1 subunit delta [Synechococcus sp. PCC 7336]